MDIKKEYERWLANATADGDVLAELKTLDDAKIEDAFYRDLAFGTGGLRGVIGACKLAEYLETLRNQGLISSFNETLWYGTVEQVRVTTEGNLRFIFRDGQEITV